MAVACSTAVEGGSSPNLATEQGEGGVSAQRVSPQLPFDAWGKWTRRVWVDPAHGMGDRSHECQPMPAVCSALVPH